MSFNLDGVGRTREKLGLFGRSASIGSRPVCERHAVPAQFKFEPSSVLLSQLPQGLLDLAHRLRTVCYRLGWEFSGVEATHTWAGDVLGRGPYQAVTALNSLLQ